MSLATPGSAIAGAPVGLLMLDTRFPRIPGDAGNLETWPFPVLARVVRGASPARVVGARAEGLLDAFVAAGRTLVADGARGIVVNCGFMCLHQHALADAMGVPVLSSALIQIPMIEAILPAGMRAGVLTVSSTSLSPEHLAAAGARPDTPVASTEEGRELSRVLLNDEEALDVGRARSDVIEAARSLCADNGDVGAIVLECTNMAPYAAAVVRATGLPVFSIVSAVTWFQSGLSAPRFPEPEA